jgi:transcriptional regulator with XRE-family HTH domain
MGFLTQSEKLRLEAKKRIAAREFTATELGRKIGVKQSSMSNFLAGKRNLKGGNLDRLLDALQLSTSSLEDAPPMGKPPAGAPIPLVRQATAIAVPLITPDLVLASRDIGIWVPEAPPLAEIGSRWSWTRFVAVRPTMAQINFMRPAITQHSILVIDRHRVELVTTNLRVLYSVAEGALMRFGYMRKVGDALLLLPDANDSIPRPIALEPKRNAPHQIVGQVCGIFHKFPTAP